MGPIMELPMFYLVWEFEKYAVDVQQTDKSERVACKTQKANI